MVTSQQGLHLLILSASISWPSHTGSHTHRSGGQGFCSQVPSIGPPAPPLHSGWSTSLPHNDTDSHRPPQRHRANSRLPRSHGAVPAPGSERVLGPWAHRSGGGGKRHCPGTGWPITGQDGELFGFIHPTCWVLRSNVPAFHVGKLRPRSLGTGVLSGTELAPGHRVLDTPSVTAQEGLEAEQAPGRGEGVSSGQAPPGAVTKAGS